MGLHIYGPSTAALSATIATATGIPAGAVGNVEGTIRDWQFDTTGRLHMAALGDSITEGAWGDADSTKWDETGWVARLRVALQRIYGDGGQGYIGLWRPEWSTVGTWTKNSDYAPWGECYVTNVAGNSKTITVYGDTAEIYYVNNAAMTFSYSVDGAAAVTHTASSPYTNQSKAVTVALGSVGSHTLQINGPTVGTLFLQGVTVYKGTSGLVLHNLGMTSKRAYDLQLRFDDRYSMMTAHFSPKLTFLGILANDYSQQNVSSSNLPNYETYLGTIAAEVKSRSSDLIVWMPPDNNVTVSPQTWTLAQYEDTAKAVTVANSGAWVDVHAAWGDFADNAARMYDTQHPNALGMKDMAALMLRVLRQHA